MKKVQEYVQKHRLIEKDDKVIVGLSGGADSVCLLFVLLFLQKEIDFSIFAVHINHMLRGQEAKRDADFVDNLCRQMNIPLKIVEKDVSQIAKQEKLGIEEAGRWVRREVFEQYSRKLGGAKIALAHHQNDLAETMIYHLARGTDLGGLSSIRPKKEQYIRPLLCLERKEIEQYLEENGLSYVTDSTNTEDHYTRNRIRHHVVEYLEQEVNPRVAAHMSETAEALGEVYDYILAESKKKLQVYSVWDRDSNNDENSIFLKEALFSEPDVMVRYAIREAISRLANGLKDITREHLEMVLHLHKNEVGKQVSLPYQLIARREYQGVLLFVKKTHQAESFEEQEEIVRLFGVTKLDIWTLQCDFLDEKPKEIPEKTYTKWLNYDKINGSLVLRYRKPGDYIVVNGQGGKKKLKDYLIDQKIPQRERDRIPLLCQGQEVLWVVGYRISEAYKVTEHTKKIIKLQIRGGIGHE